MTEDVEMLKMTQWTLFLNFASKFLSLWRMRALELTRHSPIEKLHNTQSQHRLAAGAR